MFALTSVAGFTVEPTSRIAPRAIDAEITNVGRAAFLQD
jgi:hypothetical protein